MAKGIRQFVEDRFTRLLPKLGTVGGTAFRRQVIDDTIAQFQISIASASAAYNFVIQKFRSENPEAVQGLGRTAAGTNVIAANTSRTVARPVGRPRSVSTNMQAANTASNNVLGSNVTLVKARSPEEVVVESIPRKLAMDLVANSTRRPKLAIRQDLEG